MTKPVIVVGSNSFSGAAFVDHLLGRGAPVVGLSRSPEPHEAFLPYKWNGQAAARFRFHQMDLNTDLDRIMDLIRDLRPDFVVNFAAQSMVGESWQHPEHWFMTNAVSTVQFHDRLRRCDFLKKYVHVSTPEVYGSCEGCISESRNYFPSTPYAVSRAAGDMSLHSFFEAYAFPVVFTRSANVYGPGQQLYRILPRMVLFIRMGRKLQLHGGGVSRRSFICIDDVADATRRVMEQAEPGEIYHIATEEMISIRKLVELICRKMEVDFEEFVEVAPDRLGKDAAYSMDSSKIRRELGWRDRVPLEEGIDRVIQWVDSYFNDLKEQPQQYIHKP